MSSVIMRELGSEPLRLKSALKVSDVSRLLFLGRYSLSDRLQVLRTRNSRVRTLDFNPDGRGRR
jgi:hypothetical protein